MSIKISRRSFVKLLIAATASVVLKLGGIFPEFQTLGLGSVPQVEAAPLGTYYGVTGWFCCGGKYLDPQGIKRCSNMGGGSCLDCKNKLLHCAFPNLYRQGYPYCDYTACNYPMQVTNCTHAITVTTPCSSKSVVVTVHTCGPDMEVFCGDRAPDCSPAAYYDRILDLTPAAFLKLAPLDQGLASARVTV